MKVSKVNIAVFSALITLIGAQYVVANCFRNDGGFDCLSECNCAPWWANGPTYLTGTRTEYRTTGAPSQMGYLNTILADDWCHCDFQYIDHMGSIQIAGCDEPTQAPQADETSGTCQF